MLIEQINEFELKVPRTLVRHVFLKLVFHYKTKISKAKFVMGTSEYMTILELFRIFETESRMSNPILVSNKLV